MDDRGIAAGQENSGGAGGGAGREREGRSVGSGGTASVPDRRATGGTRACVAAVRARPFHPKPSATLDRGRVKNGRIPDICPFEAALFVRFIPNGRIRTRWGRAVEANSTARPQMDVRFARILSVWIGQ